MKKVSEDLEALLHKVYLHDVHPDQAKGVIARFIVELTHAVRLEALDECGDECAKVEAENDDRDCITEHGMREGARQCLRGIGAIRERYWRDVLRGGSPATSEDPKR